MENRQPLAGQVAIDITISDLGDALGLKLPSLSIEDFQDYTKRQGWIHRVADEIAKREGWSAYPPNWELITAE